MNEIYLSVVIPAFNEEKRLERTLPVVKNYLLGQSYASEIIIVDDGSTDNTFELVHSLLAGIRYDLIRNERNRGKGYSIRRGMLAAHGTYVLFSDADFSTPIEEVEKFFIHLQSEQDIVIGSRALPESKVEIHQNQWREWMGRIYNLLARVTAIGNIRDSQCGFKCFKGSIVKDIFTRQKIDGFSFDAEILFLARKFGYKVLEYPVIWRNSEQTRVQLLRDPLLMFIDLFRIRWLHRKLA